MVREACHPLRGVAYCDECLVDGDGELEEESSEERAVAADTVE